MLAAARAAAALCAWMGHVLAARSGTPDSFIPSEPAGAACEALRSMRSAPAVSLSVRPSPHWRAALALLATVALGSTVAWAWQRGDALSAGATAAVGLLALHALRSARRRPPLG